MRRALREEVKLAGVGRLRSQGEEFEWTVRRKSGYQVLSLRPGPGRRAIHLCLADDYRRHPVTPEVSLLHSPRRVDSKLVRLVLGRARQHHHYKVQESGPDLWIDETELDLSEVTRGPQENIWYHGPPQRTLRLSLLSLAMAEALQDDPFYQAITIDFEANPRERLLRLAEYCAHALDEAYWAGHLEQVGKVGAALWLPAGGTGMAGLARQGAIQQSLGPQGWVNYRAMEEAMQAHQRAHLGTAAWYLSILAVAPTRQGRGLGASLMRQSPAGPAFLETFSERTLGFYQKHGFLQQWQLREPVTGRDYWLMRREN